MKIQLVHENAKLPTLGSEQAAGYDIYMPEGGVIYQDEVKYVNLGIASEVPDGYAALILPRSGVGFKQGLDLRNTCGVIDADYRGEWKAALRLKTIAGGRPFEWSAGDRLLQFLLVPVFRPNLTQVDVLDDTKRGLGGFGSTGTN